MASQERRYESDSFKSIRDTSHEHDAEYQGKQLLQGLLRVLFLEKVGKDRDQGDVEECARCERHDPGCPGLCDGKEIVRNNHTSIQYNLKEKDQEFRKWDSAGQN